VSVISDAPVAGMSGAVVYSLQTKIEESTYSIWHLADNILRGFRGCLTEQITLDLSGSAEGKVEFRGFALNEVFMGPMLLSGAKTSGDTELTVGAGLARRLEVGPNAADVIYAQVNGHSEIMKVTGVRWSTGGTAQFDYAIALGTTIPSAADKIVVERAQLG